jgi:hypothetical protein
VSEPDDEWQVNYFNYFTEVEEHFQRARGTGLFLLSPLDWALVESWKNAGIPLEAVLRGIDAAFEKWRSRRTKFRLINSLAYCAQAVMEEAEAMAGASPAKPAREAAAPFSLDEVRRYLEAGARQLREHPAQAYGPVADSLDRILAELETHYADLEQLEQRLTALEEKMAAIGRAAQSEEDLFRVRRELELQLRPFRSKMTAAQLALLEKQYLDRKLLEAAGLPRLSLFYLR